jgi:hypothetical protein
MIIEVVLHGFEVKLANNLDGIFIYLLNLQLFEVNILISMNNIMMKIGT